MARDLKLHELLDSDIIQLYMRKHNVQRSHIEDLISHVSKIRQIKAH